MRMMSPDDLRCGDVEERLPWLLNRSLPPEEAAHIRQHLSACAGCRATLEETSSAWQVFAQHPTIENLLDRALDRVPDEAVRRWIDEHLGTCTDCQEHWATLRQSQRELGIPRGAFVRLFPQTVTFRWQLATVAASLVGVIAIAGWISSARRVSDTEQVLASRQSSVETLTLENSSLRATESRLDDELSRARQTISDTAASALNLLVVELLPDDLGVRGDAGSEVQDVSIPQDAASVTFVLGSPAGSCRDCEVELRDEGGKTLWSARGLRRLTTDDYTLHLPAAILKEGALTFHIYDRSGQGRRLLQSYSLRVEKPGPRQSP